MLIQYCLSFAVTGLALLLIAAFVFFSNRNNKINLIFSLYSFAISWWSFFSIPAILSYDANISLFWCRTLILGAIFIPTLFFHFVVVYLQHLEFDHPGIQVEKSINSSFLKRLKPILFFAYAVTFFFILSNILTNLFIQSAEPKFSLRNYSVPGPIFHFHLLYFLVITAFSVFLLFKYLRDQKNLKPESNEYKQLKYLAWISFVGYLGGLPNYTLVYNFEIPIINPYGTYAVAIYGGITAYIIFKYKFLNIEVIIRRTAVFAGLFAFVYGVFSVVTILGQEFFKGSLGWNQWTAMIPTVLIITLALRPLETLLTNATERFLFQKKYDYRILLKTFTNEVLTVLDIQQLPHQTVAGLIRILKLESASILLHEKEFKNYRMLASIGVREKELSFDESGTFITYIKAANHPILKDKEAEKMEGENPLKESFKKLNAQLCLPISLHDNLIGVLALGAKKSGEEYTQEDIDILNTLARTEAIAISNARLFDELSKTQAEAAQREKMAVIGTLAAGINHEICNPLGIVRGQCEMFLLNYRDALYKDKTQEEVLKISADVMNKVIKETDRATAITKKLSGFAKPSKKDEMIEVHIDKELDEVVSLIGHDLQLSNIEFKKDFPQGFPAILADHKQIQEILFNIIRNAAQAIDKKDGRIIVSGFSQNGSAIVRIADNGSGIPPDKIGQIFNPFYTTKAPGKGTGLGLFIVKQVVEKNKGTIEVESDAGIGTTFTLRFPVALPAMVQAA